MKRPFCKKKIVLFQGCLSAPHLNLCFFSVKNQIRFLSVFQYPRRRKGCSTSVVWTRALKFRLWKKNCMRFFGMMWNIAKIKLRKQKINTLRREESLSISRTFSFFLQMKPVSLCPCSCPCSFLHFRMQTPCFLDSTSTTVEQQKQKIQQENGMDIL